MVEALCWLRYLNTLRCHAGGGVTCRGLCRQWVAAAAQQQRWAVLEAGPSLKGPWAPWAPGSPRPCRRLASEAACTPTPANQVHFENEHRVAKTPKRTDLCSRKAGHVVWAARVQGMGWNEEAYQFGTVRPLSTSTITRRPSILWPSAILYAVFMSFLCSNSMKAYPRGFPAAHASAFDCCGAHLFQHHNSKPTCWTKA